MCEHLEEEIEELKAEVKQKSEQIDTWRRLWVLKRNTGTELRAALSDTKAELSVVRSDLADTTETLDKYRELRAKMSKALSVRAEERDLARELFQGMVSEYADLLDRYSKMCDDYGVVVSHVDAEHGEF